MAVTFNAQSALVVILLIAAIIAVIVLTVILVKLVSTVDKVNDLLDESKFIVYETKKAVKAASSSARNKKEKIY